MDRTAALQSVLIMSMILGCGAETVDEESEAEKRYTSFYCRF